MGGHHPVHGRRLHLVMLLFIWGLLVTVGSTTADEYTPDAVRGKVVAGVRCSPCHYLNRTLRKVGPGLLGIFNRAPTISGVPFVRWDAASLNLWLQGPRRIKPNTRMWMPPLPDRDRQDIVAWLSTRQQKD